MGILQSLKRETADPETRRRLLKACRQATFHDHAGRNTERANTAVNRLARRAAESNRRTWPQQLCRVERAVAAEQSGRATLGQRRLLIVYRVQSSQAAAFGECVRMYDQTWSYARAMAFLARVTDFLARTPGPNLIPPTSTDSARTIDQRGVIRRSKAWFATTGPPPQKRERRDRLESEAALNPFDLPRGSAGDQSEKSATAQPDFSRNGDSRLGGCS